MRASNDWVSPDDDRRVASKRVLSDGAGEVTVTLYSVLGSTFQIVMSDDEARDLAHQLLVEAG